MWFARYIITSVAKRLATDPEFRGKAVGAYHKAKPVAAAAGRSVSRKIRDLPPVKDPKAFGRSTGRSVGSMFRRIRPRG